jgi:uncharacterized membrane protein
MAGQLALDHGEGRFARRLRATRYKVALAIAALEGILVLAGAIPWWLVVALAIATVAGYVGWGRDHRNADVRVVTWTAAVSQLIVVLVPVLAAALFAIAVLAIVLLAGLLLAALLLDRR